MKFFSILFLIFFSNSCSSFSFLKKHKEIDSVFQKYVDLFVILSNGSVKKKDIKGLTIGFYDEKDVNSKIVGTCHSLSYEIRIRRDFWHSISESEKIDLMLHELGHCVLKRVHTDFPKDNWFIDLLRKKGLLPIEKLKDGCPVSLMNSQMISLYCSSLHWHYYIEELFGRVKPEDYNLILWRK